MKSSESWILLQRIFVKRFCANRKVPCAAPNRFMVSNLQNCVPKFQWRRRHFTCAQLQPIGWLLNYLSLRNRASFNTDTGTHVAKRPCEWKTDFEKECRSSSAKVNRWVGHPTKTEKRRPSFTAGVLCALEKKGKKKIQWQNMTVHKMKLKGSDAILSYCEWKRTIAETARETFLGCLELLFSRHFVPYSPPFPLGFEANPHSQRRRWRK